MKTQLLFVCSLLMSLIIQSQAQSTFILNFGAGSNETGAAGTIWDGLTLNGVVPADDAGLSAEDSQGVMAVYDAAGIRDTAGNVLSGIDIFVDTELQRDTDDAGWNTAPNDGDGKFTATATTFGVNVARSFMWGRHDVDEIGDPETPGAIHNVRIEGLDPGNYTVGVVSGTSQNIAHDWYVQGELAGDDILETESQEATVDFTAEVGEDGILTVGSNSIGRVVSLFQALFVGPAPEPLVPFEITTITPEANGDITLTWNSDPAPGTQYTVLLNTNLSDPVSMWGDVADTVDTAGESTTFTVPAAALPDGGNGSPAPDVFFRILLNDA